VYPTVYGKYLLQTVFQLIYNFIHNIFSVCTLMTFLVDDGAVLDIAFEEFSQEVPSGYDKIMLEQSLLET